MLPVYHGGHFLRQALQSLGRLTYSPKDFEVLVAGSTSDSESRDLTLKEAEYARFDIRYIPCAADTNKAGFLNAACGCARGHYWIFTDDDCRFFPDWLERYAAAFDQEPEAGLIGGPDVLEDGASGFDRSLDYVLRSPLVTGRLPWPCPKRMVKYYPKLFNMGIPASAAQDVSGSRNIQAGPAGDVAPMSLFDAALNVHEDVELAEKIEESGRTLRFCPDVRVKHFRNTSWRDFLARNLQLGRTCRALKVHRLPQTLLALLVIGLGASLAAAPTLGMLGGLVLVLPGSYLLTLAISAMHGAMRTRSPGALIRIPFLMAGLHLSRGLGYLIPQIHGSHL
jgi:GT2 family glycosyltransferase